MKALQILKNLKNEMQNNDGIINWDCSYEYFKKVDNAIKEIEAIENNIKSSIEEIKYALSKPEYASVYLNNALRFLNEKQYNM